MGHSSSDLISFNVRLKDTYGVHPEIDRANFRLVWSTNLREKRKSTFDISNESGIFLRTEVNTVREVLKYPSHQNRNILEKLVPVDDMEDELVEDKFSYEPLYVFEKQGKALPLNWFPIQYAVHFVLFGKDAISKNTSRTEDLDISKIDEKERAYFEDEMQQAGTIFDAHYGVKGVAVPSNYELARFGSGRLQNDSLYNKNKAGIIKQLNER